MKMLWCMLLWASGSVAQGDSTAPDELPTFKPGMWSFSLTVNRYGEKNPQVHTMTRCADPGEEIRSKWRSLAAQSCKFSPITHTGNTWSYSSSCHNQGHTVSLKSLIIVDKEGSYRAESQSHTETQASREIVVARRVGDCPGPGAGTAPFKERSIRRRARRHSARLGEVHDVSALGRERWPGASASRG